MHLEGDQQASIFVHVTIADYHGEKVSVVLTIILFSPLFLVNHGMQKKNT